MDTASIDCSEPARWSRDSKRGCLHAAAYLSSVSLLALTLLPQVARADNECGTGTTVVCSPSGNPYANGIRYNSSSGQNLSFEPGVAVDTANDGLYISNGTAGDIVINTSAGTVTTSGDYRYGINASNNAGGVTVTTGDVTASGTWASGISAWSANGPVVIDTTAGTVAGRGTGIYASGNGLTITTADVGSSDGFSHAINAATYGTGNVLVDTTAGTVSTQGESSFGIFVNDGSGSPSLTTRVVTGDISTAGPEGSSGIVIRSSGIVEVDTTAGTVSTQGVQSSGIAVVAGFGNDNDGPAARSIDIRSGAITTAGAESAGIHVYGQQSAVTIDTTAGAIETRGASSAGLLVGNAAGDVSIRAGRIATSGEAAYGIAVTSEDEGVTGTYRTEVVATQPITVTGANAGGIAVRDVGSGGPVTVTAEANVTAQGQNAVGIAAGSFHAPVAVTVNSGATVMGGWSQSPDDLSTGASTSGASSMTRIGGGLPAAGIVLFSGAAEGARLTNNGTIGAMNDRAVTMGFPCATRGRASGGGSSASFNMTPTAPGGKSWLGTFASAIMEAIVPSARAAAPPAERGCGDGDPANSLPATQAVTIDNNALMTGYVTLWDGAGHTFNNNGTFAVRHFADTNGDGLRDTKAVSVSDFGGPNSSFNNSGTVRFAPVANAPATDATGYYVPTTGADSRPLEAGFYDLNREGLVQGQFVNLQTFNNSGTIDLRGPEIGNTLVMTSNPTAGGAPGTGTFVTNGGQLLVNTRLNDGIAPGGAANSYSDMLIVDRTQMGSAPTAIGVSYDPAVAGALTPGNGIEIVEVRDKANSAAGVFTLGNRVAGSAYEYRLYHNGVGADAADGNWYLRSTRIPDPETPPPAPGPDPDPGQSPGPGPTAPDKPVELPDYRVEVPVDAIVPALASRLGMTMIGTLDDRYGPDFAPFSEQPPAPAPAREIWCKDAARNFRCTPTPQQNAYYAGVDQQAPLPAGHLFWARVFGQFGAHNAGGRSDMDRLNAFERNGASYGYRMGGIQFGAHLYRDPLNTAGVYVGYGRIGATVDTVYGEGRAGSVAMDAYSLGGYWTHRRPGGWYVDTVLQGTLYGAISATSVLGESLATRGWGFAASLETGHPVALGAGWTITPQLQAIYQTVGIDGGADRFGQVHYADTQTVYGRIGARLARDFAIEDGRRITTWARVNYWHTFGGNGRATFANLSGGYPVALGAGLGGSWMQFGIGASGQITQSVSLFASADYNLTVAHGSGQSYTGRVGLQVRW